MRGTSACYSPSSRSLLHAREVLRLFRPPLKVTTKVSVGTSLISISNDRSPSLAVVVSYHQSVHSFPSYFLIILFLFLLLLLESGGHQLSMRSFASAAAAQSRAVSSTSTQSRFAARGQPSIDASVQNMTRSDIRFTQNHHLTAAISDWAHAEGLPFNIAESARFQSVLTKARLVGDDYTPPNRKLISGDMLTLNHSKIMEKNTKDFKKHISTFGALAMGDGATIAKMPLVNELWQTGDMPPTVFGIHDCTGHMAAGGKKDVEYIAGLFEGTCHKFDPDNAMGLIDIFAFDGASNVQKAGDILNVKYPTSHTIHGVEHVFSLFFDDCAKLKPIKVCVCMMLSIGSLVVLP